MRFLELSATRRSYTQAEFASPRQHGRQPDPSPPIAHRLLPANRVRAGYWAYAPHAPAVVGKPPDNLWRDSTRYRNNRLRTTDRRGLASYSSIQSLSLSLTVRQRLELRRNSSLRNWGSTHWHARVRRRRRHAPPSWSTPPPVEHAPGAKEDRAAPHAPPFAKHDRALAD